MLDNLRVNPFTPGKLVTKPSMFVGRAKEFRTVVKALYETGNGTGRHLLISGHRGIGKSSLAMQAGLVAEGNRELLNRLEINTGDFAFDFLVAIHRCESGHDLTTIVQTFMGKLKSRLERAGIGLEKVSFKFELNLGLVKAEASPQLKFDTYKTSLMLQLADAIETAWDKHSANLGNGIVLVIDEIDRLNPTVDIGSFIKVLTEELATRGLDNISIMLVGLTDAIRRLSAQHPSAERIAVQIPVDLMSKEEGIKILEQVLSQTEVRIESAIAAKIADLSAGFPDPIHLLGYACFDADTDDVIDERDFESGLNYVVTEARRQTFNEKFRKAGSGQFRQVLKAMAAYPNTLVPFAAICEATGLDSNRVASRVGTLIQRDIIERYDRSIYYIKDRIFRVYINTMGILDQEDDEEDQDAHNDPMLDLDATDSDS